MNLLSYQKLFLTVILAIAPLLASGCASMSDKAKPIEQAGADSMYSPYGASPAPMGAVSPASWSSSRTMPVMPERGRYRPLVQRSSPSGSACGFG